MIRSSAQPKPANKILTYCGLTIFTLIAANVFVSVKTAYTAHQVAEIEHQKTVLQQQLSELSHQQSKSYSLAEIDQFAEEQGFVGVDHTLALELPSTNTVASR